MGGGPEVLRSEMPGTLTPNQYLELAEGIEPPTLHQS